MFRFDSQLTAWLHRDAVDFRMNINGLAALVKQSLQLDPLAGGVFVFTNRRRDRIKLFLWDRNRFWLLMKRLEQDRFAWPRQQAAMTLTVEQLHWLLDGIDIAVMHRHPTRIHQHIG
jgi:transposase